jgi:CDP-diacylglycerol---serine O-phosphatidyltransferase
MIRIGFPRNLTRTPDRRPTRIAYALPTAFTAGNMFLGFIAIMRAFEGSLAGVGTAVAASHFSVAAQCIGWAMILDGLDGRIARMTNTTSDFGKEMDSMSDVITFGIAPAILAFTWGVYPVDTPGFPMLREHILRAGTFGCFLFLACGSARLARFNITTNPVPKNPGRPDRKYFVGVPIPAAASLVAAVIYAADGYPLRFWPFVIVWIVLMACLGLLMVSTWRYRSFKDLNLNRPRSPLLFVFLASLIFMVWNYSHAMLLTLAVLYVGSGVVVRVGGILNRAFRKPEVAAN